MLTRRRFTRATLQALMGYALVDTLVGCAAQTVGGEADDLAGNADAGPITEYDPETMAAWIREINALGDQVKAANIEQASWQRSMEELLGMVDMNEVASFVDMQNIVETLSLPSTGASKKAVVLPDVDGLPQEIVFVRQVFGMRAGRAIVPHGHDNMVSTFLILRGQFRGRHFQRLEDEPGAMIIAPSIDRSFVPGDISSLSDLEDNVHWYLAENEPSYMLNLHVRDIIDDGTMTTGRLYVDPNGEKLSGDRIRAPRISYEEATALYGTQG